jgi:hypothetical protein
VISWDAFLIAAAIIAAAAIISNTLDRLVVDFAEDLFTRWDAMVDDED